MKVTEHLEKASRPLISFEIIPPLRGRHVKHLLALIDDLVVFDPPFIDITSHAGQMQYHETADGIKQLIKRKRPGTLGVCALIQNKYNIDAVPHVLCLGFTREETEDFLIELKYLGIDNVLAIRGDDNGFRKPLQYGRSANDYAIDLVQQIGGMNRGQYLEADLSGEPCNFSIGVAGYPEKHFEAPNLETDIRQTKAKLDAGAGYVVTQMFFDNQHYFRFVDACRERGIEAPIIPGLKILNSKRQLKSIPSFFYCDIPTELADEVESADPKHVLDIGVEWALRQSQELIDRGVPSVHFYVMQSSKGINRLMKRLKV